MAEPATADIYDIPVSRIHVTDRFFAQSPEWLESPGLKVSVERAGLLNPLRLREVPGEKFQIVSGFRRMQAALDLGLSRVPAVLAGDSPDWELFLQTFWENLGTRKLLLIEKAFVLAKLRRSFGVEDPRLVAEFLPVLDIPPTRAYLSWHLELASTPEALQRLVPDLEPEIALGLSRWTESDREFFLGVFKRYHLGRNRQVRFFQLLDELRSRALVTCRDEDLAALWISSGAEEHDHQGHLNPGERFDRILESLWSVRYPLLFGQEQKARRLKAALKIPADIRLNLPRFLEGDRITVQFSFRDPRGLENHSVKLLEIARSDELKELLDLL